MLESAIESEPQVKHVHVLRHGRALCPLEGVPRDWPEGHMWVVAAQYASATCICCVARAKEILIEEGLLDG